MHKTETAQKRTWALGKGTMALADHIFGMQTRDKENVINYAPKPSTHSKPKGILRRAKREQSAPVKNLHALSHMQLAGMQNETLTDDLAYVHSALNACSYNLESPTASADGDCYGDGSEPEDVPSKPPSEGYRTITLTLDEICKTLDDHPTSNIERIATDKEPSAPSSTATCRIITLNLDEVRKNAGGKPRPLAYQDQSCAGPSTDVPARISATASGWCNASFGLKRFNEEYFEALKHKVAWSKPEAQSSSDLPPAAAGTQFTCFTGTKSLLVQVLTCSCAGGAVRRMLDAPAQQELAEDDLETRRLLDDLTTRITASEQVGACLQLQD